MTKLFVVSEDDEFIDQLKRLEGYEIVVADTIIPVKQDSDAYALFDVDQPIDLFEALKRENYQIIVVGRNHQQPELIPLLHREISDFIILPLADELLRIRLKNNMLYSGLMHELIEMSEFKGFVAHVLKNPLTSILGYITVLLSPMANAMSEDQKLQAYRVIQTNAHKMEGIINELRDITALEAGSPPKPYKVNLYNAVDEIVKAINEKVKAKNQTLIIDLPENLPLVFIVPKALTIAMNQLLDNAVKFTHEEGTIRIFAEMATEKSFITVGIQDNGIGIPSKEHHLVFTKYFRSDSPLARQQKGAGLGHLIAKGSLENSSGVEGIRLWFESEEDKGSTFYFTVPIAE
jgi:signal transduction histidine kinase